MSSETQTEVQREALKGWRAIVGHGAYPGLLFGGALAAWGLMSIGMPKFISVTGVALVAGLTLWWLEVVMPYTSKWKVGRRVFGVDLFHLLVSTGLTSLVIEAALLGIFVIAAVALSGWLGMGLWPTSWPLMLQVALGLTLGELGAYWAHRVCHLTDVGWRVHAMHHSSEALHVLASGRNHPLNVTATMTLQSALPILMGVTPEVLVLMSVMTGINGLLQHSNVDIRPGRLMNLLFSTSDLHRWHHAKNLDHSNTNFGNNLIIWDHVFGTYFNPECAPTTDAGVEGLTLPDSIVAHLALPFRYDQAMATSEDASEPPCSVAVSHRLSVAASGE